MRIVDSRQMLLREAMRQLRHYVSYAADAITAKIYDMPSSLLHHSPSIIIFSHSPSRILRQRQRVAAMFDALPRSAHACLPVPPALAPPRPPTLILRSFSWFFIEQEFSSRYFSSITPLLCRASVPRCPPPFVAVLFMFAATPRVRR